MLSFTGQVNFYTKIHNPHYNALGIQNLYQPSNYYDTAEKIPDDLQDSFQHGITQLQDIASQLPDNEDINIRVVQDHFFRSGGLEIDLRKPNIEQSTFKAGPINDLQNIFENFIYEVQNKLYLEQEEAVNTQNQQQQPYNPYAYQNPQQQNNQNYYYNPFAPVQAIDSFKEEPLYDNMTPDAVQNEDAGNAEGVPFSFAPTDYNNQYEQGGYEGVNNHNPENLDGWQNPYATQDFEHQDPTMYTDSSFDFNQGYDPNSIYI